MKLQNTTLKELTAYLYRVETSENIVFIKRLSISKTVKQAGFINAVLQAETSEM
jgi:general secretion pathway protein M